MEMLKNAFASKRKVHKKMTQTQDDAYDKKMGWKEGSKRDLAQDKREGIHDKKKKRHMKHKLHKKADNEFMQNATEKLAYKKKCKKHGKIHKCNA